MPESTKTKPRIMVVDSSVAVKWLNTKEEKLLEKSDKVVADFQAGKIHLIAPELSKYEIGNALLNKKIDLEAAKVSLASYYIIPIEFVSLDIEQANLAMEISYEANITFYDASFMALAQNLGVPLITDNPKHQGKVKEIKVIPLKNY